MSLNQNDLLQYFNKLMTPQFFEDYAPNGLQIEGKPEIKRLAFAVSATQDSIKRSRGEIPGGLSATNQKSQL